MRALIDRETGIFTRGEYGGKTIREVAEEGNEGVRYLYFIIERSNTDEGSIELISDWLEANPEYKEE